MHKLQNKISNHLDGSHNETIKSQYETVYLYYIRSLLIW